MKLDDKFAFCSPTKGRRTQSFHLIFIQPGEGYLAQPCIVVTPLYLPSRPQNEEGDGCDGRQYRPQRMHIMRPAMWRSMSPPGAV